MQRNEGVLVTLFGLALCIFLGMIVITFVQCSSASDVAKRHESEVISKCQLVNLGLYTACLKREWDRIHEEEK